jgi:hypothetical protein
MRSKDFGFEVMYIKITEFITFVRKKSNLSYSQSKYFFSSPIIFRVIKSRKMQSTGVVAHETAKRNATEFCWGNVQ